MSSLFYPEIQDLNLQSKLYKKREFHANRIAERDIKNESDITLLRTSFCDKSDFRLQPQQINLRNFINPSTPYRGVLIFHGTGVGKTCAGIQITESFKVELEKTNTRILMLVPGQLLKQQFRGELVGKCTGNTYMNNDEAQYIFSKKEKKKLENSAFGETNKYYQLMSYKSFHKRVLGEKISELIEDENQQIKKIYKKVNEKEFERELAPDRIDKLDNTILIVDEAHNITDNEIGLALQKIINNSKNIRIILMTATPMSNTSDEIVELMNFILPTDKRIDKNKIFEGSSRINLKIKDGGLTYLMKKVSGYISYLRGADPLTFALRNDIGTIPPKLKFTKLFRCSMEKFQYNHYIKAMEHTDDYLDRKTEAASNFVFPLLKNNDIIPGEGISALESMIEQIKRSKNTYNNAISKKFKLNSSSDLINITNNGHSITGKILHLDNIKPFSIKFHTALSNINDLINDKCGISFVYSNLVRVGIDLFEQVLINNGYIYYGKSPKADTRCYFCGKIQSNHSNNHNYHPATYVKFTGGKEENNDKLEEDKSEILKIINNTNNMKGKNIKIILGSVVMNEGVSLKNIKSIHILDTYFNIGRINQAIGRGIRHCSHYDLMNAGEFFPIVNVYKYVVSLPDKLSSEELIYRKAEEKHILIKMVERALKMSAIDCPNNRHGNIFKEELKKYKNCIPFKTCPEICDYQKCDYNCMDPELKKYFKDGSYIILDKNQLDFSTFEPTLATYEIEFSKRKIKNLYKQNTVSTFEQILDYVKKDLPNEYKKLFDDVFVVLALNNFTMDTKTEINNINEQNILHDQFNNPGYIIHRGIYYIFQPINKSLHLPLYLRKNFDTSLIRNISIKEYLKRIYSNYISSVSKTSDEILDKRNASIRNLKYKYDMDYYSNRNENEIIGSISQIITGANIDNNIFKLRYRQNEIEKKRGKGILSELGARCTTYKLSKITEFANKLGIKYTDMITKDELCNKIMEYLLDKEKNSNDNKIYVYIPTNPPQYRFPNKIHDRIIYIKNQIYNTIGDDIPLKDNNFNVIKPLVLQLDNKLISTNIKIHRLLEKIGGISSQDKNIWTFDVNDK